MHVACRSAGFARVPQRRSTGASIYGIPPVSDMSGKFSGLNAGYVAELYERFRQDPQSVDAATRAVFERGDPIVGDAIAAAGPGQAAGTIASGAGMASIVGAVNLAESLRKYGHLKAQLDPLGTRPIGDP